MIAALHRHGELDRAGLAYASGVPRGVLPEVLARLRAEEIIVERSGRELVPGRSGRPPVLFSLAPRTGLIGVVALTHATLQSAIVGFDGTIHAQRVLESGLRTLEHGVVPPGTAALRDALADASLGEDALACAVVGLPVPVNPLDGTVIRPANPAWGYEPDHPRATRHLEADPAEDLGRALGVPVWAENDANLGALGEGTFGAAQGMSTFVYLKMVAGVGAGIVIGDRLHRGRSGLAGELAHLHIQDDGPICICGGRGCLMTQYSSPRLIDLVQPAHLKRLMLDDVLALAAEGDPGVTRLLGDLGRTIGRSLADFCVYLNPEGIILDSMLGDASEPVIDGIRDALHLNASPAVIADLKILPGALRHRAEILGAVVLARTAYLEHEPGRG